MNFGYESFMYTFIVAHQDDWQLCMADAAYDALMNANHSKVLFIYLTAGDAGDSDIRHYQGREEGARASVRHILENICEYQHAEVHELCNYNGHTLDRFSIGNISSVFLRIRDIPKMMGPSALMRLVDNKEPVTSLAPSINTYRDEKDLVLTIAEITRSEGINESGEVWLAAIKNNRSAGHRDHKLTARLTTAVAMAIANEDPNRAVNIAWFEGTNRKISSKDESIHKRVAALLPYEAEMLKAFPDASHCTLSEDLIISRCLLLKEVRSNQRVRPSPDPLPKSGPWKRFVFRLKEVIR